MEKGLSGSVAHGCGAQYMRRRKRTLDWEINGDVTDPTVSKRLIACAVASREFNPDERHATTFGHQHGTAIRHSGDSGQESAHGLSLSLS